MIEKLQRINGILATAAALAYNLEDMELINKINNANYHVIDKIRDYKDKERNLNLFENPNG